MKSKLLLVGGALAASLMLTACGGGGGGGGGFPIVTLPTPPATGSNIDAFIAYVQSLLGATPDNTEPADVTAYDPPPTNDTLEPVATP